MSSLGLGAASGAVILSAALVFSGCGGGGGGGFSGVLPGTTVSGNVVQKPVQGAQVHADKAPFNGELDTNEVKAPSLTDAQGAYTIGIPAGYGEYRLVSKGGQDADGNPGITMLAPPLEPGQTSGVMSPLSTMLALADNPAKLAENLGVTAQTNPFTQPIPPATLAIMKAAETVLLSLQTAATSNSQVAQALVTETATKLANSLAAQASPDALKSTATITSTIVAATNAAMADVAADPRFAATFQLTDAVAAEAAVTGNVAAVVNAVDAAAPVTGAAVTEGDTVTGACLTAVQGAIADAQTKVEAATTVTAPPADTTAPVTTAAPAPGTSATPVSVTLAANEAAVIYYTIDGSAPTTKSRRYDGAILLSSTATVKFFAVDAAGNYESVKSATYTISVPDQTPPAVTLEPPAGTYSQAVTVILDTEDEEADIYYTLDGTPPTKNSTRYRAPIVISSTRTLKYFAVDLANNASAVASAEYTILGDTVAPVTTATPNGGVSNTSFTVTLSANEGGSTIYYTTNGSEPTTSSPVYTGAIAVSTTTTLRFFSVDAAGNAESPKSATFTIDTTPPTVTASPNGATFTTSVSVTLTSEEGADIYYTTNGSTPDGTSTQYTAPIVLTSTATVRFIARDAAGNWSAVESAVFTKATGTGTGGTGGGTGAGM